MQKKNVLVTGGAGFIGSHLVDKLLEKGHRVTVLDNFSTGRPQNLGHLNPDFAIAKSARRADRLNPTGFNLARRGNPKQISNNEKFGIKGNTNLILKEADVSDFGAIKEYFKGIDWVFHLAALADIVPSITNPSKYHRSNVDGTFSVLEASRLSGVKRFIYTASSSCYGLPDIIPTLEDSSIKPEYPYALTKYVGECYAMSWAKVYKLPVVSLRLFNVYGPRSRTSGTYGAVFGVFLAQKLAGKPFTVVGDGNQTRDFTYVSDVARAFIAAAESDISGEIFNVGSGNTYSVNRLVELLGGEKVYIPKRPGEPDSTFADISKIKKSLSWKPEISFEEGVKILLENIDYWKEAPVWTPEKIKDVTKEWFRYLSK